MSNANALMKGHTWSKARKHIKYPAIAEVKYDEIRLDVRREDGRIIFRSFADKPLHNLDQFALRFEHLFAMHKISRLDCGVLVNGNFNDTYRYTRSSKGVPEDLPSPRVRFVIFDVPEWGCFEYEQRRSMLDCLLESALEHWLDAFRPEACYVANEDAVMQRYASVKVLGFEGLMVKNLDHTYQLGKRIHGWAKVKPEEEADGVIVKINRAHSLEGVPLDRAGSVGVRFEDGSECDAGGIPHDLGAMMMTDPEQFLSKWCVVKYMERDRQGGYRHPSMLRLREDKV